MSTVQEIGGDVWFTAKDLSLRYKKSVETIHAWAKRGKGFPRGVKVGSGHTQAQTLWHRSTIEAYETSLLQQNPASELTTASRARRKAFERL